VNDKRISDYGLIGDGETAALVDVNATIEWLCMPRFDSPACFAAILGTEEHGCWKMSLGDEIIRRRRRYRGDSLILETDLTTRRGTVRIIDFMPIRGEAPDVVRIVECLEGEVELTSSLALRFDYGRIHPLVRQVSAERSLAISGPDAVSLDFDAEIEFENRRFTSRLHLSSGESSAFVLTWYPSHEDPPDRVDPREALDHTERYWEDWLGKIAWERADRGSTVRSLITLKALIYRETGGIVAAPTSSLPENAGGERNWDYRYCWLRDSIFTLRALVSMGLREEAAAWTAWLRRAVGGEPISILPFYSIMGGRRNLEWQADWLPGFNGATPVRFGNDAQGQLQLDVYGEVIDVLFQAHELGIPEGEDTDVLMRLVAERLEALWEQPDAGIWESRGKPRQHTYSKVMCWVAFAHAAAWFEGCDDDLCDRYRGLALRIRKLVLDRGFDRRRNAFVSTFGGQTLDAALLRLPLVGFLPPNDERVVGTVAAIEQNLCANGFVRRYLPKETDDGLDSGEGVFVAASFWLCEVYHMQGRFEDARRLFDRLVSRANDLGLLAEELAPSGDMQLGNFPQGLSHIALVRAAARLAEQR
jgi:GH15 family glucan-1,4-alpha-glucosidase